MRNDVAADSWRKRPEIADKQLFLGKNPQFLYAPSHYFLERREPMWKKLFFKKSVAAVMERAGEGQHAMRRHLGPIQLTALGIGAIVGAGVFIMTGTAAGQYAGPAVTISFALAALICIFAALCYAELASLIPSSGGVYTYAHVTLGELGAWLIGWCLTLEYLFSASTVAVGWAGYFTSVMADMGIAISSKFASAPFVYDVATGWSSSGSLFNLPAMLILGVIGVLIAYGIKAAAVFNNIMVFVKMTVILLVILIGFSFVNMENWIPFVPENTGVFGNFGWSGVLRGAGIVFFAYIGFDSLSTLGEEARNPQKDLPRGMIGSLAISTVIYILAALVITGIVSYKDLFVPDPFAVAVDALGPKYLWMRFIVKLGILAGSTTVILVMLLGQTRILYSMAKDRFLPKTFSAISPKTRTPFINTLIVTAVGMLFAGVFPVAILGQLVSMGTLLAFAVVCIAVLILRRTQPALHRPFKAPFVPLVPLIGAMLCIGQMCMLPLVTWQQLLAWVVLGLIVYFAYGARNSRQRA